VVENNFRVADPSSAADLFTPQNLVSDTHLASNDGVPIRPRLIEN
jgi:hypothetical protein